MTEEKSQEKYMELQFLQQQLEQLQKYSEEIEAKQQEFIHTQETLDELNTTTDTNLFVPLAQGIFAKAKLTDEHILVNVGADTAVTKKIPEVKELIKKQIEEVQTIRAQLDENTHKVTDRMNEVIEELQKAQ